MLVDKLNIIILAPLINLMEDFLIPHFMLVNLCVLLKEFNSSKYV